MTSGKLFGLFLLLAVALIVMACTTPEESSCDTAWAKAAAISDLRDTVEDLDPAIRACTSLQEWESAAAKYPEALDGVDPVLFLSNRCFYGSRLLTLCQWLIAHPDSIDPGSALAIATMASAVLSQPTTAPTPTPDATPAPAPTATPTPESTPDPLIGQIEDYLSATGEIFDLWAERSEDRSALFERYDLLIVSADWKAEFSELLDQVVQLYEKWIAIEPPEPFRGYHETAGRSFRTAVEQRDLFVGWMNSFGTDSLDGTSPWDRSIVISEDHTNIMENALEALEYGLNVYAELRGVSKPNINTGATTEFADGTYVVGAEIRPGTYRSNSVGVSCYWERLSGFGGTAAEIIANQLSDGPSIVTIDREDSGFRSEGCGSWVKISP